MSDTFLQAAQARAHDSGLSALLDPLVADAVVTATRGLSGTFVCFGCGEAYVEALRALLPADSIIVQQFAPTTPKGQICGALVDTRVGSAELENSPFSSPLDLRKDTTTGEPASEWLLGASVSSLERVLQQYASLHDPLLASRLAEVMILRQRANGRAYSSIGELADTLSTLQREFATEHANQLPVTQILRALRISTCDDERRLEAAISASLERMQLGACVVVATYSPWEHAVVRRVIRDNEVPSARVLEGAVRRDCLAALYPLLAREGQTWAVRRANAVSERQQGVHSLSLHVLQKVAQPGPARLAAAIADSSDTSGAPDADESERPRADPVAAATPAATIDGMHLAEVASEIASEIAAHKAVLSAQGLSKGEMKRDATLRDLHSRQDRLHASKLQEKIVERELGRVHVSVLLHEAVDHLMQRSSSVGEPSLSAGQVERQAQPAAGEASDAIPSTGRANRADALYVDGTFGRGGHSQLILSKLAPSGRLRAFDIDPMAVEVGRRLNMEDGRFDIIHAYAGAASSQPACSPCPA